MSYINDIKHIKNNKDTDSRIEEICVALSENYKMSSILEIVMEYYTLCEMIAESINPELECAGEELKVINDTIFRMVNGEAITDCLDSVLEVRKLTTDRMNILTAYVDKYLVYEYVLGKLAPSFEMTQTEIEEELKNYNPESYTEDILRYIFSAKDNAAIYDRFNEVLECLPVRMSRKKYLGMVEKGLELYEESDKASFDEYVYMLRTSAMLYECNDTDGSFDDYEKFYMELKDTDYDNLSEDYYKILMEKLGNATVKLNNMSDAYMCIQKLVNMLYVYAVNSGTEVMDSHKEFLRISFDILNELHDIVSDEQKSVSMPQEGLVKLEGYMEELYEARNILAPMAEDMELTYESRIDNLGLAGQYENLSVSDRLFRSFFADISISGSEPVTAEYLMKESEKLMSELQIFIKNNQRQVVRAVIGNTITKLPLPFKTSDEVKDYILNSLEHCSDRAELVTVKRDIDMIL